ncbi:MAG: hypothetical protein CMJ90_16370 [Planctomycetes bacterium]|nr:hypothetical protein [Planctomycetota bacterium]
MRLVRTALLVVLALSFGCKGTEAYLSDLYTATEPDGTSKIDVYDADILIHEALVGIMDQEVLTVSQMGRAAHHCGRIGRKNRSALLRADSVSLLAHLALRYPLPALSESFSDDKPVDRFATDAINAFDAALKPLETEHRIAGLSHPDRIVAEENWVALKELTGERFPLEPGVWERWWEENRERLVARAQADGRAPLRTLAYLRYGSLPSTRAVLGYLSTRLVVSDLPDLRELMRVAHVRLARLVAEYGIARGLRDESPAVRAEASRAARRVLAAGFGEELTDSLAREVDPVAKVQLLQTLEWYPSRMALELCLAALSDTDRSVSMTSRDVLTRLVGRDFGDQPAAWMVWWEREGKTRWP